MSASSRSSEGSPTGDETFAADASHPGESFAARCALLDRLFAAISAGDIGGVGALYAPDIAVWHNYDNGSQGGEENLRLLRWVSANVEGLRYEDVRRTATADGRVLQQHVMRGTTRTGEPLELLACMLLSFSGDRISRIDEYLDSAQFAVLRALERRA